MRDEIQADIPRSKRTLIIGNGDISSLVEARDISKEYGCDGVMVGRGIFGKPWFFTAHDKKPEERLTILVEHASLFEKFYGGKKRIKNFAVMKKHFKAYVSGWDGAKELRTKLMESRDLREVKNIVKDYLSSSALSV